jgi:hypothetical protein
MHQFQPGFNFLFCVETISKKKPFFSPLEKKLVEKLINFLIRNTKVNFFKEFFSFSFQQLFFS